MPVVAASVYLAWKGYDVKWVCAALALVGNVIFHAAGNLLSDWWDYRKGVDNEEAYAIPNLVFHHFEPREYLCFSGLLFAVGIAIGLLLTVLSGWKLLIIGVIGFILAASYSFFKFRDMGDIFVFTCFGVLPVIGTSFVAAGFIDWSILVLSLPLGIFTIAVLHDNNTVDIATDKASGIHTLPMLLGERTSVKLYIAYMAVPYIAVIVFCIIGLLPFWALVCILSAPVAYKNASQAARYFRVSGGADGSGLVDGSGGAGSFGGAGNFDGAACEVSGVSGGRSVEEASDGRPVGREAMLGLDQKTAQLHLIFSVLLAAGLAVAAIF